jgi:hypothetical protein
VLSGDWSFDQHEIIDYHARFATVAVSLSDLVTMTAQGLSFEHRFTGKDTAHGDMTQSASVDHFALNIKPGVGAGVAISLSGLTMHGVARDLDLPAYRQWVAARAANWSSFGFLAPTTTDADGMPALPPRPARTDGGLRVDRLAMDLGGQQGFVVRGIDMSLSADDVNKPMAEVRLSISHSGLEGNLVRSWPTHTSLSVAVDHLPIDDLLTAFLSIHGQMPMVSAPGGDPTDNTMVSVTGPVQTLWGNVLHAGTRARIEELAADGDGWGVRAKGQASLAADGATVTVDAQVNGLDALLAGLGASLSPAVAETIRQAAQSGADAQGQAISLFHVIVPPVGKTLLNGHKLDANGS